jgi:hypothetical protein
LTFNISDKPDQFFISQFPILDACDAILLLLLATWKTINMPMQNTIHALAKELFFPVVATEHVTVSTLLRKQNNCFSSAWKQLLSLTREINCSPVTHQGCAIK